MTRSPGLGGPGRSEVVQSRPSVLAVIGSPSLGGRSLTAARAVLDGAESAGADTQVLELGSDPDTELVQEAIERADGILFASPTYRARSSSRLKALLEQTQRGLYGESRAPLLGKATAILHTGASAHHYLAVDDIRSILAGFFCAQVLSPGLYLEHADYADATSLCEDAYALATAHGRALAEFTVAVRSLPAVTGLRPQL